MTIQTERLTTISSVKPFIFAASLASCLFLAACAQGPLSGRVAAGKDDTNSCQTVSSCRKAAEQGNAVAQNRLGFMYENIVRDDVQAIYWYHKAAEQGLAQAQYNLGWMYEGHRDTATDGPEAMSQAARWYRKAADQGYAPAQNSLGVLYEDGDGVTRDDVQSVSWWRKAAEQGDARAQVNLGRHYDTDDDEACAKAVFWYHKAAEQGYANAQYLLGTMYALGHGVAQDSTQAAFWYRKAAAQGDNNALGSLDDLQNQ